MFVYPAHGPARSSGQRMLFYMMGWRFFAGEGVGVYLLARSRSLVRPERGIVDDGMAFVCFLGRGSMFVYPRGPAVPLAPEVSAGFRRRWGGVRPIFGAVFCLFCGEGRPFLVLAFLSPRGSVLLDPACLVWFGLDWFGLVWFGLVWFGLVLVWFDAPIA